MPSRLVGPLLLAAALGAPLQCARKPSAEARTEDDAAEVLYTLADQFKAQGNASARAETLRFLVAHYPTSRFSQAARLDLEGAAPPVSGTPPAPPAPPAPPTPTTSPR